VAELRRGEGGMSRLKRGSSDGFAPWCERGWWSAWCGGG
jgi:hypothetical protein